MGWKTNAKASDEVAPVVFRPMGVAKVKSHTAFEVFAEDLPDCVALDFLTASAKTSLRLLQTAYNCMT